MALGIYISPASMTAVQYDEIMARLDAAGAGQPAGRLYHSCFGTGDESRFSTSGSRRRTSTSSA